MHRLLPSLSLAAWILFPGLIAGETPAKTVLTVKGMTCGGCAAAVKRQLKKTEGVTAYDVSLEKGEVDVTYDAALTDPKTIAVSVSKTGFQASVKEEKKKPAQPE